MRPLQPLFRDRLKVHRLGVIGRRGQAALWAQAARRTTRWKLGFCYHPKPAVPQLPFQQTRSWPDFLRHSDAIVIASPTPTHAAYLRRLSRDFSGPVLVEKPVAARWNECRALLKTLPPAFLRRLYVAQNWRFYPWVQKIRSLLGDSSSGAVLSAEFQLSHDYGLKPGYAASWRSEKNLHPIGPAETQGIHWIDLVHYFFGPVVWVGGGVARRGRVGSAPDTATIFLKSKSGVFCSIHLSYVAPVAYYARIVTSRMICTYQDGTLKIQKQPCPPKTGGVSRPAASRTLLALSLEELREQPLRAQLRILEDLLSGRPKRHRGLVSLEEGMANVAVLEGFTRSLQRQRPFCLETIPGYATLVSSRRHTMLRE